MCKRTERRSTFTLDPRLSRDAMMHKTQTLPPYIPVPFELVHVTALASERSATPTALQLQLQQHSVAVRLEHERRGGF